MKSTVWTTDAFCRTGFRHLKLHDVFFHYTDGSFGLASYYASNMVLQRATPQNPDLQTQLWGPAGQIGDSVEVGFDGNVYNTEAIDTPAGKNHYHNRSWKTNLFKQQYFPLGGCQKWPIPLNIYYSQFAKDHVTDP